MNRTASDNGKKAHVPALDGLRAFAILAVLAFHLNRKPFYGGYLGVDVFFVLSGLLITTVLLREHDRTRTISFQNFFVRRLLRLLPALFAVAIFCAAFALAMPDRAWSAPTLHALPGAIFYFANWSRVINHNFGGMLGQTWSLGIEMQFYIVWPLVLTWLIHSRLPRRRIAAILFVAAILCMVYRQVGMSLGLSLYRVDSGLDTHCDGLLLGCALGFYFSASAGQQTRTRGLEAMAWLAAAALVIDVLVGSPGLTGREITYPLAPICTALLILSVTAAPRRPMARALSSRPATWLGVRSYSLYLWHLPIFTLIFGLHWSRSFTDVACIAVSLVAAELSYRFIESPFLRRKQRFSAASATAGLAAARTDQPPRPAIPHVARERARAM